MALRLARQGVPFADTAVQAGYADQAHMARDVRELAGMPLSQLLAANGANRSTPTPSGSCTTA
jgi:AraC-like DNA-binding protein